MIWKIWNRIGFMGDTKQKNFFTKFYFFTSTNEQSGKNFLVIFGAIEKIDRHKILENKKLFFFLKKIYCSFVDPKICYIFFYKI